jgi:tRNA A-37 threonylcarbamoyl transferase component Bud32/tetratricopeptide (TPR) repeat protein
MSDPHSPHPRREALVAYGLGKLTSSDADVVEQHVRDCDTCRQVLETSPEDELVTVLRRYSRKAVPTPPPPRLHAGYEILEEIGRGGMAVVHKARQPGIGRVVALKRILAGADARPEELARFQREAKLAASLRHPNLVQVHDYGEQDGLPYLVMEYVEGGTLATRLAEGPMEEGEAATLVATLAEAVEHAHQVGVIHRDLKPGNVLLANVVAKIADFGLARQLGATLHTQPGAVIGTPSYMAPEQALGDPSIVGSPADIYALGAILYECLTGRPPFRAATAMETLVQVRTLDPVPPSRLQPRVPCDLETICLKCLHKEPTRRYESAQALADDLRRFLAGEPIQARPVGLLERLWKWARRKPTSATLIVVAMVTAIGLLVAGAWHQHVLSEQAERANANEAEARRQKSLVLATFARHHESLDAIYTRLEEDTFRVEDERQRAFRNELAEATLRYYTEVLRHDDPDPEMRLARGQVHVFAGRIHHLLGDAPAARQAFARADQLLGELAAEFPENAEYQCEWAYCLYRTAVLNNRTKEAELAKAGYLRVVEMVAPLVEADPVSARARRLLGLTHAQLARLLSLRQNRESIHHSCAAVCCWERLLADEPGNNEYRMRLIVSLRLQLIGRHFEKQPEASAALLRQAEAVALPFRQSPPRYLNDLLALFALGEMHRINGSHWLIAGDQEKALKAFDEGVQVVEAVLRQEPGHRESRLAMQGLYFGRALALERLGRKTEAMRGFDLAIEHSEAASGGKVNFGLRVFRARVLLRMGETRQAIAEAVALAEKPGIGGEPLRDLAHIFALAVEPARRDPSLAEADLADRALTCLRRCQKEGFFNDPKRVEELRMVPELALLRPRPEFKAFLAELTGKP